MIKFRLLLVLDEFPESADGLCRCNFDRENTARVIAEHETVKLEESLGVWTWIRNYESHKYYERGKRFTPTHQ